MLLPLLFLGHQKYKPLCIHSGLLHINVLDDKLRQLFLKWIHFVK
jgi:hypothetical protein